MMLAQFKKKILLERLFYMENFKLKTKIMLLGSAVLLLGACATNESIKQPTASGKPEQIINVPTNQLQTFILERCNDMGYITEISGNNSVLCSMERKGVVGNAALAVVLGNIDYAAPILKIRFTIVSLSNNKSKVYADYWTEMQGNGGFQHRSQINAGGRLHNDIQSNLNNLKAKLESQMIENQSETVLVPQ